MHFLLLFLLTIIPTATFSCAAYGDDYRHAGLHRGGGKGWGNMGEAVVRHEPGKYSQDCPAGYRWNTYRRRCNRVGSTNGIKSYDFGRGAPRMGQQKRECEPGYEWHVYRQRCDRSFRNGNAGQPLYPRAEEGEHSKECPRGYSWNLYRRRCVISFTSG